ncbi:unnamed protein product [Blepharisma stoltei]|uniref:Uncharacterized protein n=1 Tax=Blepharisma stoltei TaxID=1481888 RepID=A0AAU9JHD1_9CILI|nr:unnamed protein product [Blepharisma stoltei]
MTSPARDFPLSRIRSEDPYSPVIVEDLLGGLNEWRSVQDIVRLTFKALSDIVKSQGSSLREIDVQFPTKASKAELNSGLSVKVNISDFTRSISELRTSLENKVNIDDVYTLVEDKISRNDAQYLLSSKVSYEELKTALEAKADLREIQAELRTIKAAIEEVHDDAYRRLQQCATLRDIQQLDKKIETKANAAEINQALQEKANTESVASALHKKANRSDIDALFAKKVESTDLMAYLEHKADLSQLDILARELELKADKSETIKFINHEISKRVEKSDIDTIFSSFNSAKKDADIKNNQKFLEMEQFLNKLKNDLDDLQTAVNRKGDSRDVDRALQLVNKKVDAENIANFKDEINNSLKNIQAQVRLDIRKIEESAIEKSIRNDNYTKAIEEDLTRLKETFKASMEKSQVDLEENLKYIQSYTSGTRAEDLKSLRHEIGSVQRDIDEIRSRKVDKNELRTLTDQKIDTREFQERLELTFRELSKELKDNKDELQDLVLRKERDILIQIDKKPDIQEVNSLLSETTENLLNKFQTDEANLRCTIDDIRTQTYGRAQFMDLDSSIKDLQNHLEQISKEILLKANIKDICVLLDMKPNIEDINKILQDLHDELDKKAAANEFHSHINSQALINEALCGENCMARWIWKSGEVRTGYTVPWEVQSVNTCPDNFLWEKDKTSVLTIAPGLYEVFYGFFARKKPNVQLMVNGEPVITDSQTLGKVWGRHSSGNIAGLTVTDFIALPARARISITYTGDAGAEGFLGLKKL